MKTIKLENISVYGADTFFPSWIKSMSNEEIKFLKEKKLENFEQLEKMIVAGEKVPIYFIKLYELVKKYISKEHMVDKEPQIYRSDMLKVINERDLEVTEEETLCSNLLLNAVIDDDWRVTFLDIEKLNIKNLRFFLNHVIPNGKNSLELFPRIGTYAVDKVIKVIHYYEDQIIRQNLERHTPGINLFTLNKEEKKEIVEQELSKYVEYLLSFSYDFIWGKRSKTVSKLLEECLLSEKKNALRNKRRLIETFTNYMTLTELEEGAIENHTLDRFMLTKTIESEIK